MAKCHTLVESVYYHYIVARHAIILGLGSQNEHILDRELYIKLTALAML